MPNNEWNRLVGQRWRELSAKEHEPFRMMALQDKKRYETVSAPQYLYFVPADHANYVVDVRIVLRAGVRCGRHRCGEASQTNSVQPLCAPGMTADKYCKYV